jgi:hypothetical protein
VNPGSDRDLDVAQPGEEVPVSNKVVPNGKLGLGLGSALPARRA